MAACDPVLFDNIDETVFNCLKAKLGEVGYELPGTAGTIHGPMGIEVDFEWNNENQVLRIQVMKKNFLVSCSRIEGEIGKAVNACTGTQRRPGSNTTA
ncbi:MAG: hypothetical protein M3Q97_03325 [Bacteroidota bacterium]|nr:hypothetical protein [Bacteroidota bacterium]